MNRQDACPTLRYTTPFWSAVAERSGDTALDSTPSVLPNEIMSGMVGIVSAIFDVKVAVEES
jgi:hypothetical protein